jgi:RNA polymerase sigma-70 factor (ECF subfamily)
MSQDPLSDSTPDDDLLRRIAAGDSGAFSALFRRRQRDVYRFVLHMTGLPAVAEDVTQEVFLTLMRDAGRYEAGRSTVTAWLCGIARNHARRRLEKDLKVQPLDDNREAEDGAPASADASPLDEMTRAERIDALRRAVLALPVRYREAVVLCDLQELSYADAAVVLDCAIGTVRSRLHRGRGLLAAKMRAGRPAEGPVRVEAAAADREHGAPPPKGISRCIA